MKEKGQLSIRYCQPTN